MLHSPAYVASLPFTPLHAHRRHTQGLSLIPSRLRILGPFQDTEKARGQLTTGTSPNASLGTKIAYSRLRRYGDDSNGMLIIS